tara:strand:+ start:677 stop:868 length:192 start_codon:yes stop_codon:yes gene_type:complete
MQVGDLVELNKFTHRKGKGWKTGLVIKVYYLSGERGQRTRIMWSDGKVFDLNAKHLEVLSRCK